MRLERFPITDEEGFDHRAILTWLAALKGRIDEIGIEYLFHHNFHLIIQPRIAVLCNPRGVIVCCLWKIPLRGLAVLSIRIATGMFQRPCDRAAIIVIFDSNTEDHEFSPYSFT